MSAILTNIQATLPGAFPGQPVGIGGHDFNESLINGMFATAAVDDITITPADSTVFTVTIAGVAIPVTSGVGATAASIRDQFIAAILSDSRVNTLVAPSANGALLRLRELQPRLPAVTYAVGAGLAIANVTAHAAETGISPGIFVAYGSAISGAIVDGRAARLMGAGDAAGVVAGVVEVSGEANDERYPAPSTAIYAPGASMPVKRQGSIFVIAEGAMAAGADIHIRRVAAGVNTILGAVRSAADGANTVQLSSGARSTGVEFFWGALRVVELQLNLPA